VVFAKPGQLGEAIIEHPPPELWRSRGFKVSIFERGVPLSDCRVGRKERGAIFAVVREHLLRRPHCELSALSFNRKRLGREKVV
jgi:hypothetical protein